MLRLVLITASSPEIRKVRRSRVLNFQQITMPYLAARVPPSWEVMHVDEEAEEIDWNVDADVVGLTFHTPSAWHAYDVASRFRARGSCIVMGGPHVTLLPEEARRYADVIFIGEAEGLWEEFLQGFEAGYFRRVYQPTRAPSLDNIPMARKDLFHRHDHTNGVLFATRGCPSKCDFCTIAIMYPYTPRKRPVAEVVGEYASFKGKVIIFWDDNLAGDLRYAKDLFRAITPYRKWWSSQASLPAGRDDEFLEAAAQSGCKQLFLGLESISQQSMVEVNKRVNRVEEYVQIIERIHAHGIAVQAGIVFGFDHDPPEIFQATLDFLETAGVENATFNILTPFPGTPLYQRLEAEGRILTRDWTILGVRLWIFGFILYNGAMGRKPRVYYPAALYHVILRGNGGQEIFFGQEDRFRLYLLLQEGIERYGHQVHAFCLMTNHVHLAVQVGEVGLPRIIQNLAFRYTRWVNRRQNKTGHLFQGRYKAVLVDADPYLLEIVRYIHLNPVRSGIVRRPEDYPWSGHRVYLGLEIIPWLTTARVLSMFSSRADRARRAYREFVEEGKEGGYQREFGKGSEMDSRILGDAFFIEKVLGPSPERAKRCMTVESILSHVCKRFSIREDELSGPGKDRRLSRIRGILAWLVLDSGSLTLAELSERVHRDSSTLSSAARSFEKEAQTNTELRQLMGEMREGLFGIQISKA